MSKRFMSSVTKTAMCLILGIALMFGAMPAAAIAAETDEQSGSSQPPAGYQPETSNILPMFRGLRNMAANPGLSILLIEDTSPWGTTGHHAMIQRLGNVEKIDSSVLSAVDYSRFDLVIVSNDQTWSTYTNYLGIQPLLEEYVRNGGTLLLGASDQGWNGGNMTNNLPGGLIKYNRFDNNNSITDSSHPVITGVMTDEWVLTDSDLYSNFASHTTFDENTIPEGGRTILRDRSGGPTLVEYPLGAGHVIASGLTWEHALFYAGNGSGDFSRIALDDLYAYAANISSDVFFFEISSAIVDVSVLDDTVDVTVSAKNNPGVAGLDLEIEFDNRGGHLTPLSITSANGESVHSNIDDPSTDWINNNKITAVWATAEDVSEDGDLFTISFAIGDGIEYNSSYAINLSGMVVNAAYEELEYSVNAGSIQALMVENNVMYGDALMDTTVDIKDTVRLAQYLVDLTDLSRYERIAANVHWDNDGEGSRPGSKDEGAEIRIDIKDAIKLGRYLAGHADVVLGAVDGAPAGDAGQVATPAQAATPGQ